MPANYTGVPDAIAPHDPPVIACPVDTDPGNAAIFNAAYQKLADLIAFLQKYAPVMGAGVENNQGPLELTGDLTSQGKGTFGDEVSAAGRGTFTEIKTATPLNANDPRLALFAEGFGGELAAGAVRRYISGAEATLTMHEAINATNEQGSWLRVVANQPAMVIHFGLGAAFGQVSIATLAVGEVTWRIQRLSPVKLGFIATAAGEGETANPTADTAVTNELRAKNIPKSFGTVDWSAVDGATLRGGFNAAEPVVGAATDLEMTFPAAMADGNYAVMVSESSNDAYTVRAARTVGNSRDATKIVFNVFDANGARVNWSTVGAVAFDFIVFGQQNS